MAKFLNKLRTELALYKHVKGHPAFADFDIEDVLKTGPDQITAVVTLEGEKVIIKKSLGPTPDQDVRGAKEELDYVAQTMKGPSYRINECRAIFPELGIIVLSFVPGPRLETAIGEAAPPERADLLRLSGGWLNAYIAGRAETASKFSPDWWIKRRLAASDVDGVRDATRTLFAGVLDRVRGYAPLVRGQDITKAPIHGDYVSINAHYHEGCIYGVDVQGKAILPVAKDVAKFLVWTEIKTPLAPPHASAGMTHRHGIAAPDLAAFLSAGVLPSHEEESILPFFIGLELLAKLAAHDSGDETSGQVARAAGQFLRGG